MGKNSDIAWTDHTWNPWQGCRKVSQGCKNCYMFRDKKRYGQNGSNIYRSNNNTFNKPLAWKKPAMVFTCSWSDFFLQEADEWRQEAWEIIKQTPHLSYQILTKRPERIRECLPAEWPLENVWLGVSAENQEQADIRVSILLTIPASIRFVSVEPMLGPVNLEEYIRLTENNGSDNFFEKNGWGYDEWSGGFSGGVDSIYQPEPGIHWVICGGESGPGFRPIDPAAANNLKNQCLSAEILFFMKQMSGTTKRTLLNIPDHLNVRQLPII